MKIIKNRAILQNPWRHSEVAGERVILPLAKWRELHASVTAKNIGVKLAPEDSVAELIEITPDLKKLSLIALDFPTFNEGRGYTQATQLRQQHNYTGEIRALGAYRDNLALLERCGVDAFEMAAGEDVEAGLVDLIEDAALIAVAS